VAVKTANTVAYTDAAATTDLSIDFAGDLEEIYIHGNRNPQELKEGHIAISGSITRDLTTGNFSASGVKFLELANQAITVEFWVALFPEGDASPKILVANAKFSGYSLKAPLKGVVQETVKFKGLALTVDA
jgi:hypothetical protein